MKIEFKNIILVIMVGLAILSRLIPHPFNFTPIGALALFGTVYFNNKFTGAILTFCVMLISDFLIGFHSSMIWVYGAFALICLIGIWLKDNLSIISTLTSSLLASITFFIITNFGVWVASGMYTMDYTGFIACYVAAIPFFGNTLGGDLFYVTILFGSFELARRTFLKQKLA
ncbi:MAG: DUF6580 family putative transport protein [Bacteroidota bacterium]|nr:DUF6580 family putative transport protein [Bacteroidota bacterium]